MFRFIQQSNQRSMALDTCRYETPPEPFPNSFQAYKLLPSQQQPSHPSDVQATSSGSQPGASNIEVGSEARPCDSLEESLGGASRRSYRQQTADLIAELDRLLFSGHSLTGSGGGGGRAAARRPARHERPKPRARNVVLRETVDIIWRVLVDDQARSRAARAASLEASPARFTARVKRKVGARCRDGLSFTASGGVYPPDRRFSQRPCSPRGNQRKRGL